MEAQKRIAKLTSYFERNVITAPEAANAVLFDLIKDEGTEVDLDFLGQIPQMPTEIIQRLLSLMEEIHVANYYWKPFMIGGSYVPKPDDAVKLRQIHEYLLLHV